jgi:hypothetical protein
MTRDDIIRMAAKETGFGDVTESAWSEFLNRFAALVAAAEREACAEVCERLPETFRIAADEFGYQAEMPTAENYAAAIRTKSDE